MECVGKLPAHWTSAGKFPAQVEKFLAHVNNKAKIGDRFVLL